ncbi:MAG: hypothetical protein JKX81_00990 [Arenicella sp.]|nr:hypothetical protein [Arenicella sp.]
MSVRFKNRRSPFQVFLIANLMLGSLISSDIGASTDLSNGQNIQHTGWLSLLNKDIGTIGTLADRSPVMQVYVNSVFDDKFYTSLWANIPLDSDNRSRSTEFDLSLGYIKKYNDYTLDFSVALFDIENPSIGDFENDILTTRFRVDKNNNYFEISHYEGMSAENGWLAAIGNTVKVSDALILYSNLSYTSEPFNFGTVAFVHSKLAYSPVNNGMVYFAEFTDQLYRENPSDPRRSALLFGIRYDFL